MLINLFFYDPLLILDPLFNAHSSGIPTPVLRTEFEPKNYSGSYSPIPNPSSS